MALMRASTELAEHFDHRAGPPYAGDAHMHSCMTAMGNMPSVVTVNAIVGKDKLMLCVTLTNGMPRDRTLYRPLRARMRRSANYI
jgi:hypothetical protein